MKINKLKEIKSAQLVPINANQWVPLISYCEVHRDVFELLTVKCDSICCIQAKEAKSCLEAKPQQNPFEYDVSGPGVKET